MAFVQGSHGRHETNGAVVEELFLSPFSKFRDLAEDFDRCVRYDWSSASKMEGTRSRG
jgi:hypothetical protein